jgi:hypothetical protein
LFKLEFEEGEFLLGVVGVFELLLEGLILVGELLVAHG